MIRRILLIVFPGLALVAASMFPLTKSDASLEPAKPHQEQVGSESKALPNFDIRLAGRAGFEDYDLSSTADRQNAAGNARTRGRSAAVEQFQSNLGSEVAQNVRAVANESGSMKSFFIDGATLSEPQSDTAGQYRARFPKSTLFTLCT